MHTSALLSTLTAAISLLTLALCNPAPAAAAQPRITPGPVLFPRAVKARQSSPPRFGDDESDFDSPPSDLSPSSISKFITCQRDYLSLASEQQSRTISDSALASWLTSAARSALGTITAPAQVDVSLTTLCDATKTLTPPAALQSAYSEYLAQSSSWASSAAPQAHSIASECGGQVSALVEWLIVSDAESCTSAVVGLVEAWREDGARTTTTGSSSGSNATATTGTTTGSGPAETAGGQASGGGNGNGGVSTSSSSTGGVTAPRETGLAAAAAAAAVAFGLVGAMAAL